MDWQSTSRAFLEKVKSKGLELTMIGASGGEKSIKDYIPYEAAEDEEECEARHSIKTGLDEDMDHKLSIPDSKAKKILMNTLNVCLRRRL